MSKQTPIPVTAVKLTGHGGALRVSVEVEGDWYVAIDESIHNPEQIAHTAEAAGIRHWPKLPRVSEP